MCVRNTIYHRVRKSGTADRKVLLYLPFVQAGCSGCMWDTLNSYQCLAVAEDPMFKALRHTLEQVPHPTCMQRALLPASKVLPMPGEPQALQKAGMPGEGQRECEACCRNMGSSPGPGYKINTRLKAVSTTPVKSGLRDARQDLPFPAHSLPTPSPHPRNTRLDPVAWQSQGQAKTCSKS